MSSSASDPVRRDPESVRSLIVLTRDPSEVANSRRWLRRTLDGQANGPQLNDACLVTSELVTNALRHGLGDVVVHTALCDDGSVQVSVIDWAEEVPQVLSPDPERIGGVGLQLVEAVAESWGVAPFPGGKTVWASIASPAARPDDAR